MNDTRRLFKSRLKWGQKNEEQIKLDKLASLHASKDFKQFWKCTNRLNNKSGLPVGVDGVTEPKQIAEVFKNQFRVQSPLGPSPEVLGAETFVIGTNITAKDVALAIKNMSRGKSPGHDGLSVEHLQHAGPHLPRVLAMFYSLCLGHSYLPAELMKTIVIPIVKNKTGDTSDKTNYRPISFATIVAKLWANCTQKQYSALEVQYNNAFRVLMGLPRHCSASAMFAEARVDRFYAIMRKRAASLLSRVRASPNSILAMFAGRMDGAYLNHCSALHNRP